MPRKDRRQGALAADPQGRRQDGDALRPGPGRGGGQGRDRAPKARKGAVPGARRDGLADRAGAAAQPAGPVFRPRGRKPAATPDWRLALGELKAALAPARALFAPLFGAIRRERPERRCAYSAATLLWTVLVGFLLHHRSRNQMDARRNEGRHAESVMALSGQRVADGAEPRTACTGTVMNLLGALNPDALAAVQYALVESMLRAKMLRRGKFLGCVMVAFDGTLRERKRGRGLVGKRKRRMTLEARITTPWGWNVTLASEPLEPWDDEREKQDHELAAFARLAPRLKRRFPRLPVCVLGDALYDCAAVVGLCRKHNWSYILTSKGGRQPSEMAAVDRTLERAPKTHTGRLPAGRTGRVRWVSASEIEYETGRPALGNVVVVEEEGAKAYAGAFVTDFAVRSARRAAEIADWGRRRWLVENGFHEQKGKDGFGLEHSFCTDETAGRNMHALMTIAYTLWQLLHDGYLKRLGARCRHCAQICWADVLRDALRLGGIAFGELDGRERARRMRVARE